MSPKSQEKKCALLQTMVAVKFVFATVQIGCMFLKIHYFVTQVNKQGITKKGTRFSQLIQDIQQWIYSKTHVHCSML